MLIFLLCWLYQRQSCSFRGRPAPVGAAGSQGPALLQFSHPHSLHKSCSPFDYLGYLFVLEAPQAISVWVFPPSNPLVCHNMLGRQESCSSAWSPTSLTAFSDLSNREKFGDGRRGDCRHSRKAAGIWELAGVLGEPAEWSWYGHRGRSEVETRWALTAFPVGAQRNLPMEGKDESDAKPC